MSIKHTVTAAERDMISASVAGAKRKRESGRIGAIDMRSWDTESGGSTKSAARFASDHIGIRVESADGGMYQEDLANGELGKDVFDAVADFLYFCGMTNTLAVFQTERLNVPPFDEISKKRTDLQTDFKHDLLNSLTNGDYQKFRSLWDSKWPAAPDQGAQRLLFLCEIFFAVFPLHPANRVKFGDINESLKRFKVFLDTHQNDLSQSTEFLPFYALPYIPNPAEHPSFKQIFTIDWFNDLKRKLSDWLDRQLKSTQVPLLVTALKSPADKSASTDAELWSATLELADALQHAVNGDIPPREKVDSLFRRVGIFPGGAVKFTATTDFSPLDFSKVIEDLQKPELAAPILKACVSRLTKAPADNVRRFYVELISGDIFSMDKLKLIPKLMAAGGPTRAYLLRAMNILATDSPGRQYLFKEPTLLELLISQLSGEDGVYMMNAVGILQKMSLVKEMKTEMITKGVLEEALKLLSDPSRLTEYTSDYAGALVMNLCMRKEAAKRCLDNEALSVLSELSGTQNQQLQSYSNAALSELFTKEPQLREKAQAIGLPVLFQQMRSTADATIVEQLDFVIKAMSGQVDDTGDEEWDEDEAGATMYDTYDEVGDEQWEFEAEGEALLAKYVNTTNANQAASSISISLRQSVSRMSVAPDGQHTSRRPITPGAEQHPSRMSTARGADQQQASKAA